MTYPDAPIMLDLDPSGYVRGLGQAEDQTERFGRTLQSTALAAGPLIAAMSNIGPKRATMIGIAGFTAVAARQQQQLSGLAATTKLTGQNYDRMTTNMRQLARELPIGNAGALSMVSTLTKMGVVTTRTQKPLNEVSKTFQDLNKRSLASIPGFEKVTKSLTDVSEGVSNMFRANSSSSDRRLKELSKTFLELGGATGEGSDQLAEGMVTLNRSMGSGMSSKTVRDLSDSLTTISAQSGASATGILQFSKAIAPMAQASGIGQTTVMGISAAFTKLGEDGFAGANAFSKMMSDLNRSAREGSPLMATYAQMAGKTTEEFKALYDAKPSEALLQVVEGIGASGNAPRMLEQIGLEGVRTARSLTNVAQSGDLRGEIDRAVGSYGNDSTQTGAQTAYGGLNDSLSKLTTTSEQLAEAMGRPFLRSITVLTDGMRAAVDPLRALASSRVGQGVGNIAAPALLGGLALTKVLSPLISATGIGQMLTSGPVRGGLAGYAQAGGIGSSLINRLPGVQRFQNRMAAGEAVGMGQMQGISTGAFSRGGALGSRLNFGTGTGPSIARQIMGAASVGGTVYMNTLADSARLARLRPEDRASAISKMTPATQSFMATRASAQAALSGGVIDRAAYNTQMRAAFQTMISSAGTAGGATRMLGSAFAGLARQTLQTTATMALGGLRRAGGAALGMVGGPYGAAALAIGGGLYATSKIKQNRENYADEISSASSWIDDYRLAMGKATDATLTFAGRLTETAKTGTRADATAAQAKEFSPEEFARALASNDKTVRDYSGGEERAASKIALQARVSGGLAPDEINRIQQDLAKASYGRDAISRITADLPEASTDTSGESKPPEDLSAAFATEAGQIADQDKDRGFLGYKTWADLGGVGKFTGDEMSTGMQFDTTSKKSKEDISDLATLIKDTSSAEGQAYGQAYADERMFKNMDATVQSALDRGDSKTAEKLITAFQDNLNLNVDGYSKDDVKKLGFSGVAARENEGFREGRYGDVQDSRKDGGQIATRREEWAAEQLKSGGGAPTFAKWYSNNAGGPLSTTQQAIQGLVGPKGKPEDPVAQTKAMEAAMQAANAAGLSMSDLATEALRASNGLKNAADISFQFAMAVRAMALRQEQRQGMYGTTADAAQTRGQRIAKEYAELPNTTENKTERDRLATEAMEMEAEAKQRVTARVAAGREAQVQLGRMEAQYRTSNEWATQDYTRQMDRMQESYERGRFRARRNHLLQMEYAEYDYRLSVSHATADFQRAQLYAQKDFNKQMRRASEDGARALYEPYQRIQVQPIWDSWNLAGNLEEQNQAIREQLTNLDTLRSQGGSMDLIKLLGLNDPKNAQQLAVMVGDIASDPAVLQQLNASAAERQKAGGRLIEDPSNTSRERGIEDFSEAQRRNAETFEITMDRQDKAFALSMSRAEQQFKQSMTDMAVDNKIMLTQAAEDRDRSIERTAFAYDKMLTEMRADIKRADQEIVGDIGTLTETVNKIMSGQFVDFQDISVDGMAGWVEVLKKYSGEWESIVMAMGSDMKVTVSNSANPTSADAAERRGSGGDGPGMGWKSQIAAVREEFPGTALNSGFRPGAMTATGKPSYHGMGRAIDIPPSMKLFNWIAQNYPNSKELIFSPAGGRQINNGKPHVYTGVTKANHYDHVHWAMAKGGIATKPTQALIAEAGSNEAVIPLNSQGVTALAAAMKRFVGVDDARALRASAGTSIVTYDHSVHTVDKSTRFEGPVTVVAQDPDEMARKLTDRKRRAALTAPAQRR